VTVNASFTVNDSYGLGANPTTLNFGTSTFGYTPAPNAQNVTITNTGTGSITLTLPTHASYDISLSTTTLAGGATATLTVQPKTGLLVGTHNAAIVVNGTNSTSVTVNVSFTVSDSYGLSANPTTLAFGTATFGYTPAPAAQNVTITNTGTGSVTLTLPTHASYDITLSPLTIAGGATATLTVRPKLGLSVGSQNAAIVVNGTNSTSVTVNVSFTITGPVNVLVTSVTLNKNHLTLLVGGSERLVATVLPTNATSKDVIWSCDSPYVATVDQTGLVTAIGGGPALITVTTVDGGFIDTCYVLVSIPATKVTVTPKAISLDVGNT
jgi:uncharacterized membrane protein